MTDEKTAKIIPFPDIHRLIGEINKIANTVDVFKSEINSLKSAKNIMDDVHDKIMDAFESNEKQKILDARNHGEREIIIVLDLLNGMRLRFKQREVKKNIVNDEKLGIAFERLGKNLDGQINELEKYLKLVSKIDKKQEKDKIEEYHKSRMYDFGTMIDSLADLNVVEEIVLKNQSSEAEEYQKAGNR